VRREEERQARRELLDAESRGERPLDVLEAVGEREADLLRGRGSGFPHVVSGDRDRIPLRDLPGREGHDVGDEPEAGLDRVDIRAAGDVFLEHVVLHGARERAPGNALLVPQRHVQGEEDRRGGVDRHRRRDRAERDPVEEATHVVQ